MIPRLLTTRTRSTFEFDGTHFAVDRGVFDPVQHLSGILVAEELLTRDLSGTSVVEIGTGCGLLAGVCWSRGARVTAVDVDSRAVVCASHNLAHTSVEVLRSDLFDTLGDQRFDLLITNPPYEAGGRRSRALRSPDLLPRLAHEWETVADRILLAFPTDSIDLLADAGFDLELTRRLPSSGRELGIFEGVRSNT